MTLEENKKDENLSHSQRFITSSIAGAAAGAIAKSAIAPLDRCWKFLANSYQEHGLTSLWRGNSATMLRIVPYSAIQYSSHEQFKHLLQVETNEQKKAHPHRSFIAGSMAGVVSTSATYPLDMARARMAVHNSYNNLSQVFAQSVRKKGFFSLYRGFYPTILGVIPYAGFSFFTYETLKRFHNDFYPNVQPNPFFRLAFGALAGLFGQTASYPLDVVRRRMQTQSGYVELGIIGTMRKLVIEEGVIHGLYKGLSLNWVKGPIAAGISFTSFDIVQRFFLSVGTKFYF